MLHTTFRLLKDAGACRGSYSMLARHLGGIRKYGWDTPIPLTVGFHEKLRPVDLFWVFREVLATDQDRALQQIWRAVMRDDVCRNLCVFEHKHPNDICCRQAVKISRAFDRGRATTEDMKQAHNTANKAYLNAPYLTVEEEVAKASSTCTLTHIVFFYCESTPWQRDRLRQYLEGTATPLPLPRKSRRKAP